MAAASFLPALLPYDVERAAQLIQQAYAPTQSTVSADEQRRIQQELFDIQKRPEAWGLVIPFLEHQDPNVQFFGAHTAQVKIARDWESFPADNVIPLRDLILELTAHSASVGRNKVILRKLFVALTSLALRLAPTHPSQWPDWLMSSISFFSSRNLPTESILDFLSITAEEIITADLVGPSKAAMKQSLHDAVPLVVSAITTCITQPSQSGSKTQLRSALKCLEAWISTLPANDLTPLIPILISLLNPVSGQANGAALEFDEDTFVPASDALQEVLSRSALSDGAGSATLTEPLMMWLEAWGNKIVENTVTTGFVDAVAHSLCKLLVALGDHSNAYIAFNLASPTVATPTPSAALAFPSPAPPRSRLVQTFLSLLLAYTGLPGHYGIDEDESEMTLGFWYLLQESLWASDFYIDGEEAEQKRDEVREKEVWDVAKAVYSQLVRVLRRKVVWPPRGNGWSKDQRDKFQVYRRDVGDTLINAYYVLRDDMLAYYVNDIVERLSNTQDPESWAEIEATLHCVMSIQEAVPLEPQPHLARIFSPDILGRLPTTGIDRVRRTALATIGTYASWFTTQPAPEPASGFSAPSLLMNAISYVVAALGEPAMSFPAANSLRDICDANRAALAPHIGAFADLHAGLTNIPDTEKSKVLQSIASVIQALPPEEEIPPVEAIVNPVVQKLFAALQSSTQLPDESRALIIFQLQTLSGVAKGLTGTTDSLLVLDASPEEQEASEKMRRARQDPRMVTLRDSVFAAVKSTVETWSADAAVSDALSELFKSITSLPSDTTIISLPPGPLLGLVCIASQRQLTATWLSLSSMLVVQLDPPSIGPYPMKPAPNEEVQNTVTSVLPQLLQISLNYLAQPGAMETNPDILKDFFSCMDTFAQHFVAFFYRLPPGLFDTLMQCAISSLALQERYSLVSACTFLSTLINYTSRSDELADAKAVLINSHGRSMMRAILAGFAGVAPRSANLNLIELLTTILGRWPAEGKSWMAEILFADDFVPSKAGPEAKEKFVKAVTGSRSMKRTREAAQQFSMIARGLEGTSFGYATMSM